eukprot:6654635-Pyramimonas_sp.AAC.1
MTNLKFERQHTRHTLWDRADEAFKFVKVKPPTQRTIFIWEQQSLQVPDLEKLQVRDRARRPTAYYGSSDPRKHYYNITYVMRPPQEAVGVLEVRAEVPIAKAEMKEVKEELKYHKSLLKGIRDKEQKKAKKEEMVEVKGRLLEKKGVVAGKLEAAKALKGTLPEIFVNVRRPVAPTPYPL